MKNNADKTLNPELALLSMCSLNESLKNFLITGSVGQVVEVYSQAISESTQIKSNFLNYELQIGINYLVTAIIPNFKV